MRDPGSFTIPFSIGKYELKKALCDSSASINLKQQTHEQEASAKGLTLKELPSHLKYEFLEPEKRKPVIISVALTEAE